MSRRRNGYAVLALVGGASTLAALPALSQQAAEPIARYTLDAGTTSGLGAMGGNPLAALRGAEATSHELFLRLGSSRAPAGSPEGEHFMPDGAGLGRSVPLVTPRSVPVQPGPGGMPAQAQMPRGRLLLFWGCGERAPKNQPVVIDFSRLAQGQVPAGLFAQNVGLANDWTITPSNSRTYGDWPNQRNDRQIPANASLLGSHKVSSTYAPDIAFQLADDFMPPLRPQTSDRADGAVMLSWNSLAKATGYYAWVMASDPDQQGEARDTVWWSSSATQQFGGALADWLSPAAVAKLVAARTVMPPDQTTCVIPAEVREAGGPTLMTQLYAYGPQADFAFPPRPASANLAWKPEWIARARFRANAMVMHGMPGMDDYSQGGDVGPGNAETGGEALPPAKPPCPKGLKGLAMRAAGLCQ